MSIKENIEIVQEAIEKARQRSPRGEEVRLIAVTKTYDNDVVEEAKNCGLLHIGENKVQELRKRMDAFGDQLYYHQIGHLQSNKVKYIIDDVTLIHSLDRLSLAKEIQKRGGEKPVPCLVQINIGREPQKQGVLPEEAEAFIEKILEFDKIRIKGLMAMAPFIADEKELRGYFRKMADFRQKIENKGYNELDMTYLSMGMSNDYVLAVEEGANMVRVGTALFGRRDYH